MIKNKIIDVWGVIAAATILVYSILSAFRSVAVGPDTAQYIEMFYTSQAGLSASRNTEAGFNLIIFLFAAFSSHEMYLFVVSITACLLIFNVNSVGINKNLALVVVFWMCYPFFYSVTLNVLRQGLAYGIVFSYLIARKKGWLHDLFVLTLAASLHYSSIPFSFIAIFCRSLSFRSCLFFWLCGLVLGYIDFIKSVYILFEGFIPRDNYYTNYFLYNSSDYKTGVRIDFLLYSIIGVIASCYLHRKVRIPLDSSVELGVNINDLSKIFLMFNGFALMFITFPYSDRYFAYSWYLYPIFLYYYFMIFLKKYLKLCLLFLFPFSWACIYYNFQR